MTTKKSKASKPPEPVEESGEAEFRGKPAEAEVTSLCMTCRYQYPRCGGDRAPGFKTENGVIVGCSMYQVPEEKVESVPETLPEEKVEAKPKVIPERLKQKREIQMKNLATK